MEQKIRMHIIASGSVQGVGFRWFVQRTGSIMELNGWVKNLTNGNVEIEVEGENETVQEFVQKIRGGHPFAKVKELKINSIPINGKDTDFNIKF